MKTNAFIDMVLMSVPSATRPNILNIINFAIGYIIDRPLSIMRYIDPTTGLDPVLETVTGTFQYTLSNGATGWSGPDISFVNGVSSDSTNFDEELVYGSAYNAGNSSATITFKEDPGTTTYYVQAYRKPLTLLSETHNNGIIPFPDNLIHQLMEFVVSIIERNFHGQSARYDNFIQSELPKIRGQINGSTSFVTYNSQRWY